MERSELFGIGGSSGGYNAQMLPQPSTPYSRSTGEPIARPFTTGSSTTASSYSSSYQHGWYDCLPDPYPNDTHRSTGQATESIANLHSSSVVFHPRAGSVPLGVPAEHLPSSYPHLPPSMARSPMDPHYSQPPFPASQHPIWDPSLYPPPQMNMPPQPFAGISPSHHTFNNRSRPRQRAHPYSTDRHPAHTRYSPIPQRPPNVPTVHPGTQFPPHFSPGSARQLSIASALSHLDMREPKLEYECSDEWFQHPRVEGSFSGAHDFVMNNPVLNDIKIHNSDKFMSEFLKETLPGAAFDSSVRDPPPRCHPETRLTIVNQTQEFIVKCDVEKRILWIVGPAGVGKSAIMQTVAEAPFTDIPNVMLGGSIFFSIKGRSDGSKAITTLAYQLAVKQPPYRQFIENEISNDPSLLYASVAVQFNKFIVEPFVQRFSNPRRIRFFILIDGLDECESHHSQCELLRLISDFCVTYPTSPLAWVVASRPEPHITSFFSSDEVIPSYEKQEVKVDSNEACEDVERFLRGELKRIQMKSPALKDLRQWPTEHDFLQLAYASKGLFVYASTVVKFIDDPAYGDPASQLEQVLEGIDTNPKWLVEGKPHPMALLDALYNQILSRVPPDAMNNTRKLLLLLFDGLGLSNSSWKDESMTAMCNWLGMTKNAAYGATHHLRSVLDVPDADDAGTRTLRCFHKSFTDYLADVERSKFCPGIDSAVQELNSSCARRILEEAPNGTLEHGPGTTADISLSWSRDEQLHDNSMRSRIYRYAADWTVRGLTENMPAFHNPFFIRALTGFTELLVNSDFRSFLFDKSRRSEFMRHNVLKQIPIGMLDSLGIPKDEYVDYQFKCPAATMATIPEPQDPTCWHVRKGDFKKGEDQDWATSIWLRNECNCPKRFFDHFESRKTQSPNDLVTVFISLALGGYVECRFINPEVGVAEWTYTVPYCFPSRTGL